MTAALPFVSVIVPTYRRPAALARCLAHLARADYPKDRYEVIVVDDGGEMDLSAVCAQVEDSLAVRLVRQANAGAAAARNHGAAAARGDVLLFTDDDCLAHAGWIRALVDTAQQSPVALVGGRTINALATNPFATASQLLVNRLCTPRHGDGPGFVNGNNLATSRAAFESAGGFDATFRTSAGEDRELSARFQGLGRPLAFSPDAVVEHANPLTCGAFVRQHLNFGRAAFRLRVHPSPRTAAPAFGSPAFYLGLLAIPVEPVATPSRWTHAAAVRGLLVVAQLANAAGFVAEWLRPKALRNLQSPISNL